MRFTLLRLSSLLIPFAILLTGFTESSFAQVTTDFSLSPSEITLKPNEKPSIELLGIKELIKNELKNKIKFEVISSDTPASTIKPEVKVDETNKKITIEFSLDENFLNDKKKTPTVNIKYTNKNGDEITRALTVNIPARLTGFELKLDNTPIENLDTFEIVKGKMAKLSFTLFKDGNDVSNKFANLDFAPPSISSIEIKGSSITALEATETTIEIYYKANDTSPRSGLLLKFKIKVLPIIKSIKSDWGNSIEMSENYSQPLKLKALDEDNEETEDIKRVKCESTGNHKKYITLKKLNNEDYTLKSNILPILQNGDPLDSSNLSYDVKIECKSTDDAGIKEIFDVKIFRKMGYLTVEALDSNTLLPNGKLNFIIRVYDRDGKPIKKPIDYNLEDIRNRQWISLSPEGEKLTVHWTDLPKDESSIRPSNANIKITARTETNSIIFGNIPIHMATVAKFAPIKVKLNIMDEKTAEDLYGPVTRKEYFVLMVRLFNDLRDKENNRYAGQSILAYSSSIEVAVGIEKKYDRKSKSATFGSAFDKQKMKILEEDRKTKGFELYKKNLEKADKDFKEQVNEYHKLIDRAYELDKEAFDLEILARKDRKKEKKARAARRASDSAYEDAVDFLERIRKAYKKSVVSFPKLPLPNDAIVKDGKWYPATRRDLIDTDLQDRHLPYEDPDSLDLFPK